MTAIAIFLAVFFGSLLATSLSIPIAYRFGFVDAPGELKIHVQQIPRFGGLGILCGIVLGSILLHVPEYGFLAGAAAAWLVGAIDDRWDIEAWEKLGGQALAGLILAYLFSHQHPVLGGLFYGVAGFVLVIGFVNAMNLVDGMNGLAAGNSFLIFIAIGILEFFHHADVRLPLVFAVATLGFLPLNFPRARTFMGDSGSLLLGFLVAFSLLTLLKQGPVLFLAGLMIAIVPIFDVVLGIVRRIYSGTPLFHGDREHFYDQLNKKLQNKTGTVLLTYLITALSASAGIAASFSAPLTAILVFTALALMLVLISHQLGWVRPQASEGST